MCISRKTDRFQQQGIKVRCWDLFEALPQEERDAVLPPSGGAMLAVELGVSQGRNRYTGACAKALLVLKQKQSQD